jgi:hypothetical protein
MSERQYERFRIAFSHRLNLQSKYRRDNLVASYSQVTTRDIHMCVNSCMAFDGPDTDLEVCRFCSERRYNSQNRPRNIFRPIDMIPRLQGMFQDPAQSLKLDRAKRTSNDNPDLLTDKWDGDHIQSLRRRNVIVNGKDSGYKYFTDSRDIAISFALDGFTFFETLGKRVTKNKYNTWLLIAIIDSLDPLERTKRKNIMILGIIPGPRSPRDLNSYLYWFRDELQALSLGVLTWDAARREFFLMRAHLVFVIGDMPAIAHVMNMKGHNGMRCCRKCYIKGVRNRGGTGTMYYPALSQPEGQIQIQDLIKNCSRTHQSFLEDVAEIEEAKAISTLREYEERKRDAGINGWSILYEFDSIDFSKSFPHDLMHLAGLNTIPNLVSLWFGDFKAIGTDSGEGDYVLSQSEIEEVGRRTGEASKLIPYAFSRAIPNLAQRRDLNADAWIFWFVSVAPYALDGILKEPYYTHAMDLIGIVRKCQQYEISRSEVMTTFREASWKWVEDYERYSLHST